MNFKDTKKENLIRVINSPEFKRFEISQKVADLLIQKCLEYDLKTEIEIIRSVIARNVPIIHDDNGTIH